MCAARNARRRSTKRRRRFYCRAFWIRRPCKSGGGRSLWKIGDQILAEPRPGRHDVGAIFGDDFDGVIAIALLLTQLDMKRFGNHVLEGLAVVLGEGEVHKVIAGPVSVEAG